jgi:hypothetical protein
MSQRRDAVTGFHSVTKLLAPTQHMSKYAEPYVSVDSVNQLKAKTDDQ